MISIIIPIYNARNTMGRCLDSVLKQTFRDFEIILIDDGSNDGSAQLCDDYANKWDKIKIIHQINSGVSKARNIGLSLACGEYICFIDSDDYVEINYLQDLYMAIVNNDADMAVCGYKKVSRAKAEEITYGEEKLYCFEDFVTFEKMSAKMMLATPWGKLFRKDKIIQLFREDLDLGEDVCFVLDYLKNIKSLYIIDRALYNYRIDTGNGSLSKKYHKNLCNVVYAVDESKQNLFEEKYSLFEESVIFRRDSLVSDVLLMESKLFKSNINNREIDNITGALLKYLDQKVGLKRCKNKKLHIINLFYKMHLLWVLKFVYRRKKSI